MTRNTRIALFLIGELVASLGASDSGLCRRWLHGGIEDLGEPAGTDLLLNSLDPLLMDEGSTSHHQDKVARQQKLTKQRCVSYILTGNIFAYGFFWHFFR